MDEQIGKLIKQVRKNKKITLNDLAGKSGLSVSYISTVERGVNSPTIANLQKICRCLNITFNELISSAEAEMIVVTTGQREALFNSENDVKYEAITVGNRNMKAVAMTILDNEEHDSYEHIQDEFGYIAKGSLLFTIDNTTYLLNEGDTIYVKANSPHSFKNNSAGECLSIWVYDNTARDRNNADK
ncbi:MAG: helix-turn-helix domain-containing protein [Oscillospiraceae bacterium]